MKNPSFLTTLPMALGMSVLMFCSCGDDSNQQPNVDSDSVAQQPPVDTTPKVFGTAKYAGTYSFGTDAEKEATGTLLVYPIADSMALVHLDIQGGPPAHNSGTLTQTVRIIADTGLIWMNNDDAGECKIALHFSANEVVVQTHAKKGCGFGAHVIADHVYARTSTEMPKYYLTGEGDTTWFDEHMKSGLPAPAH